MKVYFLLVCLLQVSVILSSQTLPRKECKTRMQISIAPGRSFHWNSSYVWGTGYVVYTPTKQSPVVSADWQLALMRDFSRHHSIFIGIGKSHYGFSERGTFVDDTFSEGTYEREFRIPYASVSVGHRWYPAFASSRVYVENSLWGEIALKTIYSSFFGQRDAGLAYRLAAGMIWPVSSGISIHSCAFFKTSILRFNPVFFTEYYSPYAYGIEAGMGWNL